MEVIIHIKPAGEADIPTIMSVGNTSFRATYTGMLTDTQIEFMLAKSYVESGIRDAMQGGQQFYLLTVAGVVQGFMALKELSEQGILRIEKLYLLPETQGKGFGAALIQQAAALAQSRGLSKLQLNVNRKNKAYYFYLKQGFEVLESVDIPYYGFILDDYIMQKSLD